jgi:predicted adenine nucleotide alpha hydrolase (AANH) superfamily ATPase
MWLHVCCVDCLLRFLVGSGYFLPKSCWGLIQDYPHFLPEAKHSLRHLQLVFANSNIYPKSEYEARLKAVKKVANLLSVPLTISDYQPRLYFALPPCAAQLRTTISESHQRCQACQTWRLKHIRALAAEALPPLTHSRRRAWSTTMLASYYLNQGQIKKIGRSLDTDDRLHFVAPRWRVDPSVIKTTGFYKQNYCGCLFSLLERTQQKYSLLVQAN